ncbi:MAG TPA: VWA domain-containing protein [Terriglobales bacterium]|jgi:VWFA-related protein
MPLRARFPFLVPLLFSGTMVLCGQQAAPVQKPGLVFRADVGEVLVQVSVLDKKGRSADDLPASDFRVYENNVLQTVDSFSHADSPVSVGIIVDNSASMAPRRVQVDQAALNFARASNPGDEVFIVKFNDEYHLAAPFTNDIERLERGLGELEPSSSTALYDTLLRAGAYLMHDGKRTKKVLLVISDGADDSSTHDLNQVLASLQARDAPMIYCIGLSDKEDGRTLERESEDALRQIAGTTGGVAYFPKNLRDVDAITRKVARDIRLQYSLIYRSNQPGPGYHSIRVEVADAHQKHLVAYTRRGYVR